MGPESAVFSISARLVDTAWRPLAVVAPRAAAGRPYVGAMAEHSCAVAAVMARRRGPVAAERSLSEAEAVAHLPLAAAKVPQPAPVVPLSERGSPAERLAAALEQTSLRIWAKRQPR
jgi:hypothetical protein